MARKTRTHLTLRPDTLSESEFLPKHLTKQDFARRLNALMRDKGWWAAELARQTELPRDSISTYLQGKSLPHPRSLTKLAEALGVSEQTLLPNHAEAAIADDTPSLSVRASPGSPDKAWLVVNRLVTLKTATKVVEIISNDNVAD